MKPNKSDLKYITIVETKLLFDFKLYFQDLEEYCKEFDEHECSDSIDYQELEMDYNNIKDDLDDLEKDYKELEKDYEKLKESNKVLQAEIKGYRKFMDELENITHEECK